MAKYQITLSKDEVKQAVQEWLEKYGHLPNETLKKVSLEIRQEIQNYGPNEYSVPVIHVSVESEVSHGEIRDPHQVVLNKMSEYLVELSNHISSEDTRDFPKFLRVLAQRVKNKEII